MKPTNPDHDFRASWRWPPDFEKWVATHCEGETINVFAGLSPIGDIGIDLQSPQELRSSTDELDQPAVDRATIQADGFGTLPIVDDAFDTTVADPPWKDISDRRRRRLFDELVRITKPGGRIIFNAWWIPDHRLVSVDDVRIRQDTDRYSQGTPSTSFATIYTVHETRIESKSEVYSAPRGELAPSLSTTQLHYEATVEARDGLQRAVEHYDNRLLNPRQDGACPQCGNEVLHPVGPKNSPPGYSDGELYECANCQYRAKYDEIFPPSDAGQTELPA